MTMRVQPTPYPEVNAVLDTFLASVQTILTDHFVGMYVYGSLALGDFDPRGSDIDFIVVTDGELADHPVAALRQMHARFSVSDSPWAEKIEAAYVPRAALHSDASTTARYPQIEKGRILELDPLESGWILQCHVLREHGIVVAGPDPRTLVAPIDRDAMRRVSAAYAVVWLDQAHHDPEWLAWLRCRDNQAFVVLTLCRMLYTLECGDVASKPAAARWARQTTGPRWDALIQRALAGQHGSGESTDRDISDTIALVEYTVERFRPQHSK